MVETSKSECILSRRHTFCLSAATLFSPPHVGFLPENYTTGLLDIPLNLCYNEIIKGKHIPTHIPSKERVKTMNAIMNTRLSNSQYVFEYEQYSFFQWQEESFILLRQRHICSASLNSLE